MTATAPLDDPRLEPTIVVFEQRPRWAPEMERQFFEDRRVRVRTCGRTRDIAGLLPADDPAVVLLDVTSDPAACLDVAGTLFAAIIGIVDVAHADLEWSLREVGVTSVLDEFTPGHVVADVCRRQWRAVLAEER